MVEKKIKVLFVAHDPALYGANVALLNIIDGMVDFNIEAMVTVWRYGSICEELEKRKINFEIVSSRFHIYPKVRSFKTAIAFFPRLLQMLFINFKAELKLSETVEKFQPDLIHTNIGPVHIGYSIAKKKKIPHVWHIREYQDLYLGITPFPSKYRFIDKLHNKNNSTIAITKGIFNHYLMNENSKVIYDGVMKRGNTQFIPKKSKYFLFLGRLEEMKGIRQLLIAFICFAQVNDSYDLLIAGEGSDIFVDELRESVDKSGYAKRIHFLGFRKDISELLSKATALIVPSKHEGFGFITVEAMFNGCLVIGHDSGGTKEILQEENLGILYTSNDELVSALNEIVFLGIENYFPLIQRAQDTASKLYSEEENASEIYNFYIEILAKSRKHIIQ